MTTPTDTAVRERTRATGADLRAVIVASASWLNANAERINALNVFPVPDGDTCTNMSLTLQAAADAVRGLGDDAAVSLRLSGSKSRLVRIPVTGKGGF